MTEEITEEEDFLKELEKIKDDNLYEIVMKKIRLEDEIIKINKRLDVINRVSNHNLFENSRKKKRRIKEKKSIDTPSDAQRDDDAISEVNVTSFPHNEINKISNSNVGTELRQSSQMPSYIDYYRLYSGFLSGLEAPSNSGACASPYRAFGAPGTPPNLGTFVPPTSGFGAPSNTPAFGAPSNSGAFGSPSNSGAFGVPSNSGAFGVPSNTPAFGAPSNGGPSRGDRVLTDWSSAKHSE